MKQTSSRLHLKSIARVPFAAQYPPKKTKVVLQKPPRPKLPPKPKPPQRFCEECGAKIGPTNHVGLCVSCRAREPLYLPTEEEIAAECAKIRAGWNSDESYRRRTNGTIEQ